MKNAAGFVAIAAAVLLGFAVPSDGQGDSEYVIVANKQLQGTTISTASLKGIYLREIRSWGSEGGPIIAVDLAGASGFYQNLFGKTYVQMQAYWLNMRINYSVDLPVSKRDPESVKQFIAENKGAIGFLRNRDIDDRVKVLKIVN
jgi:ABC-type phosphate transport system substrate-binding protein